tara:strand:- start:316 stop:495 length:180 start_codon:yes stop_codon:yes gene_type:complete
VYSAKVPEVVPEVAEPVVPPEDTSYQPPPLRSWMVGAGVGGIGGGGSGGIIKFLYSNSI